MKNSIPTFSETLESINNIEDVNERNYMFLFFAYEKAFDFFPYDEVLERIKEYSKDETKQSSIDFWRIWFVKNNQEQQRVIICALLDLKINKELTQHL